MLVRNELAKFGFYDFCYIRQPRVSWTTKQMLCSHTEMRNSKGKHSRMIHNDCNARQQVAKLFDGLYTRQENAGAREPDSTAAFED